MILITNTVQLNFKKCFLSQESSEFTLELGFDLCCLLCHQIVSYVRIKFWKVMTFDKLKVMAYL